MKQKLPRKIEKNQKEKRRKTNIVTATLPEVPGAQGGQYHVVSWSFGFLRTLNMNIATTTPPKVPGAQGGQYRCHLQEFHGKLTTFLLRLFTRELLRLQNTNIVTSTLLEETMLILFTLDTRYLESHYRHFTRIQRLRKPPINESLIFCETLGDDVDTAHLRHQETTLILSTLGTRYF
ncbi:hypothetical protein TSAR_015539 [Trichomalopsis sarcophagae]|uniref:Uncharacterized protein n=1 Tax=Trichomalopsis sarcophagae TaxID=543379 RepID=A0A232EUG1_9HYME|nr:hypothetical protein TSAR_015539 [Trichomalopsis sarcophagae]